MELLSPAKSFRLGGCYLEITSSCNLRCLHCYNESGVLQDQIDMPTFMSIINDLPDHPDTSITISGGEPTSHPEFWDFMEALQKKQFGMVLVITNGTYITREVAEKFASYKVAIQLSVNGSRAEIHDQLCGRGSFNQTMRGLKHLLNAGVSERILIRSVLTGFNKDDIVNLLKMVAELEIPQAEIASLSNLGRSEDNKNNLYLDILEKSALVERLERHPEVVELIDSGVKITLPDDFTGACPLLNGVTEDADQIPLTPRIDSSGNVFLCQLFTDAQYAIGNVNETSLSSMLESQQIVNLVKFLQVGQNYMNQCQSCIWNGTCGKGCVALAVANGGSIQDTDGCCKVRTKYYVSELKKNRKALVPQ